MKQKLDTRQTILVGMAFLSICAFWQMYNNVIPLILTNTFHMNETLSGMIMAADNVLGLILLPLFGGISDRTVTRWGRRKPFILAGTIAAVILMMLLPLLDDSYFSGPAVWKLAAFVAVLGALLVAMGSYRSPAVALMPDVTPKPLRSRGNAIINLMGAIGGILYLVIATLLYSQARTQGKDHVSYLLLFGIIAGIMLLALLVIMSCVDEPALVRKAREADAELAGEDGAEAAAGNGQDLEAAQVQPGSDTLAPEVRRRLGFLLASIALWFIAYNAVETWFTTYAAETWGMSLGSASLCLTIGTVGAILTYLPAGAAAGRWGRKRTIQGGILILTAGFLAAFAFAHFYGRFHAAVYVVFVLVGIGWAMINVNSLPMVVEMCRDSDIGKFTGYYYTFSMAAQTITPILAGFLMNHIGYHVLFPYAAAFAACSFVTLLAVRHGDSRQTGRRGLEAFEEMDI